MRIFVGILLGSLGFTVGAFAASNAVRVSQNTADSRLQARMSSPAPAPTAKDWAVQWRTSLMGRDFDSQETSSKLMNFRFDLNVKYRLSDDVMLKVTPTARLQSGSVQTSDTGLSPENKFYFNEASATWKALSFAYLKAGALNMGESHSPLLVDSRPFPGARLGLHVGDRGWRTSFIAEAAVPTTVGLNTNQGEKEPTPTLQSYALKFEWVDGPLWKAQARAGAFAYSQLPTSIANSSRLLGNTVDTLSETESRFQEKYAGVEMLGELKFPLPGPVDGRIAASAVQNTAAPKGFNQAMQAEGDLKIRWNSKLDLLAGGEYFRSEPDAAVASFVRDVYSGTNRAGYRVEAGIAFGKRKARLLGGAGESELIYQNTAQSRERFVLIKLETEYADF